MWSLKMALSILMLVLAPDLGLAASKEQARGQQPIDYTRILVSPPLGPAYYFSMDTGKPIDNLPVLLEPWKDRPTFSEGLAPARRVSAGKLGYVDRIGNFVIEPQFDDCGRFSEGRATAWTGKKVGLIDIHGEWVVKPGTYDTILDYSEGRCAFKKGDKWGFCDRDGRVVIPAQYTEVGEGFHDGCAYVKLDFNRRYLIDAQGRTIFAFPNRILPRLERFSEGLAAVNFLTAKKEDDWRDAPHRELAPPNRYGFISPTGKVAIRGKYMSVGKSSEGLVPVSMNDPGGVLSADDMITVEGGGARSRIDRATKRWGYINTKGQLVIPMQFQMVGPFRGGLAAFYVDGKWGYIDRNGEVAIPAIFDFALDFQDDGLAEVGIENKIVYIDRTGRIVIETGMDRLRG